jgi:hypothetical protein
LISREGKLVIVCDPASSTHTLLCSPSTSKTINLLYSNHFLRTSLHRSNHSVATMAATDSIPIIKVLFTLHPGMDALDFVGPLEVLSHAKHNINDDCKSMA